MEARYHEISARRAHIDRISKRWGAHPNKIIDRSDARKVPMRVGVMTIVGQW